MKRLETLLEPLPDYEGHDGLLVSNGSDVMYEHSETWTFPTGEQGLVRVVTVHKVVDGKIAVWKDYWDMAGFMAFAAPVTSRVSAPATRPPKRRHAPRPR